MNATSPPPLAVLSDPESALALLDPERRRLAEALAHAPDSAAGLARRLGEKRQRLNYHLRVLEDAGVVELQEERTRGNRTERVLRLAAERFVVDPATVGRLATTDPEHVGDRFSTAYLVAVAARTIRELAHLLDRAQKSRARLATASFDTSVRLASPAHMDAFVSDMTQAIAEVVARHQSDSGGGMWFRVMAGVYPGPRPTSHAQEDV